MNTANIVGNDRIPAIEGRELQVLDPATDELVATVPDSGPEETRRAIDAAASAFEQWRLVPPSERAEVLLTFADALKTDRERLASILTREQGKPLAESRAEIDYAASFLPVAAEAGVEILEERVDIPGKDVRVLQRPVGVTAAITPWNFPIAMLAKKTAPAMAAGCVQVIKPAEQTPLSGIAFVELGLEAGIPPGVLNVVTGTPGPIGDALLADSRVRKISFTGSTEVGRHLMRGGAENLLRLSLELGGHAPMIVFEDADLDRAIEVAMKAKFRNAGQTCISPNRFLVHHRLHDAFVERLADAASNLVSGRGDRDGVDLGPLIDDVAVAKVFDHIDDALARGAEIASGGGRRNPPGLTDRFPEPTVLLNTGPGMRCWHEETFGPVCPVRSFTDDEEAIELANRSDHGLAGYAVTDDPVRIERIARDLQAGIIGVNDGAPAVASVPFGGIRHSGFGREGGRWGVLEHLETITVSRIP
ncbi:MAG: succinate-semialdehyde dehydrogenase (NADP(+)) [Phycisphaerae bacterium]|nr:succinate-semialdehyde dehydrogenase (NADP(+)) [Phycisphaerae bacterium]